VLSSFDIFFKKKKKKKMEQIEYNPSSNQNTNNTNTVKLDALGPVIINQDGTLSRISNWQEMTPQEQQKTLQRLQKRNQSRLQELESSSSSK
jgi:hypothetical protein